jgi:hypothetical protein
MYINLPMQKVIQFSFDKGVPLYLLFMLPHRHILDHLCMMAENSD